MRTLVSVTLLLIPFATVAAQSSGASASWNGLVSQPSVVVATDAPRQVNNLEDQADTVLVVPTPDLKPEALSAITEDMTIMCRIFDKAVDPGKRSTGVGLYLDQRRAFGRLFAQPGLTQGLYLGGYGALFFVEADFPLVPGPQQKQESKPAEATDRVWSQTWNELRGQEQPGSGEDEAPAYDAQKVDTLKATVLKTLRHAANLRTRPQDQIAVVITSQTRALTGKAVQRGLRYSVQQSGHLSLSSRTSSREGTSVSNPAPTLVLRVSKADVDALAAGQLTADQFAAKVQTLWSTAQSPTPEAPASPAPGL
jgi:hypothetical protein